MNKQLTDHQKSEHIHSVYKTGDWLLDIQTKEVYKIVEVWGFPASVTVKYLTDKYAGATYQSIGYYDLISFYRKLPKDLNLVRLLYID